jgi:hypothetical protein
MRFQIHDRERCRQWERKRIYAYGRIVVKFTLRHDHLTRAPSSNQSPTASLSRQKKAFADRRQQIKIVDIPLPFRSRGLNGFARPTLRFPANTVFLARRDL